MISFHKKDTSDIWSISQCPYERIPSLRQENHVTSVAELQVKPLRLSLYE
jgi:hypothetical protein